MSISVLCPVKVIYYPGGGVTYNKGALAVSTITLGTQYLLYIYLSAKDLKLTETDHWFWLDGDRRRPNGNRDPVQYICKVGQKATRSNSYINYSYIHWSIDKVQKPFSKSKALWCSLWLLSFFIVGRPSDLLRNPQNVLAQTRVFISIREGSFLHYVKKPCDFGQMTIWWLLIMG